MADFGHSNIVGKLLARTKSKLCKKNWLEDDEEGCQPHSFYAFSLHPDNAVIDFGYSKTVARLSG